MLVINSIEKARLSADSYSYSGTGVAWKARLVLFLGFALMAGGLAGSVVCLSCFAFSFCALCDGGGGCGGGVWRMKREMENIGWGVRNRELGIEKCWIGMGSGR